MNDVKQIELDTCCFLQKDLKGKKLPNDVYWRIIVGVGDTLSDSIQCLPKDDSIQ